MNVKGTLVNIDDAVIDASRKEGHRKGWDDRRLHDSGIIEDAIRESRNFRGFIATLRERMEMLEEWYDGQKDPVHKRNTAHEGKTSMT